MGGWVARQVWRGAASWPAAANWWFGHWPVPCARAASGSQTALVGIGRFQTVLYACFHLQKCELPNCGSCDTDVKACDFCSDPYYLSETTQKCEQASCRGTPQRACGPAKACCSAGERAAQHTGHLVLMVSECCRLPVVSSAVVAATCCQPDPHPSKHPAQGASRPLFPCSARPSAPAAAMQPCATAAPRATTLMRTALIA